MQDGGSHLSVYHRQGESIAAGESACCIRASESRIQRSYNLLRWVAQVQGKLQFLGKNIRMEQLLMNEIEFEWLRQFYIQGEKHRQLHAWWHQPMQVGTFKSVVSPWVVLTLPDILMCSRSCCACGASWRTGRSPLSRCSRPPPPSTTRASSTTPSRFGRNYDCLHGQRALIFSHLYFV